MQQKCNRIRSVWSSSEWHDYFRRNATKQRAIPWENGAEIAEEELKQIANSLCSWQLGETSDGSHLLKAAQKYASVIGDPDFVSVIRLFIAEEQRHGELLGKFLDLAGIERIQSDWGDTLFRAVRYLLPSMELWTTPVVMVETLAMVYYGAIRKASQSTVLRMICKQILSDEVPHIRFQCERLALMHRNRGQWLRWLTLVGHRLFFTCIVLLVWIGHRKAFQAGGVNFSRYWRISWRKMRYAWNLMNPDLYQWRNCPNEKESIPPSGFDFVE